MQLEPLRGVTGPAVDRGRHPVQKLAHVSSVELHHRVQALHLTQELHSLQSLTERRGVGGTKRCQHTASRLVANLVQKNHNGQDIREVGDELAVDAEER